ncbi:MAG: hypothetical protein M3015_11900 [Bacteroidota bacterium]|nr:hypothetical protein [Bacteroidota bacterium]
MKKIWLLVIASSMTVGAMATNGRHVKHKCKSCTQKVCTPACKDKAGCSKMSCDKS